MPINFAATEQFIRQTEKRLAEAKRQEHHLSRVKNALATLERDDHKELYVTIDCGHGHDYRFCTSPGSTEYTGEMSKASLTVALRMLLSDMLASGKRLLTRSNCRIDRGVPMPAAKSHEGATMDSPSVIEVPIVILVDDEGNFTIGHDKEEALERYAENWQDPLCLRCVLATVMIEKPKPAKIRGDVPLEAVDVRFKAIKSPVSI